MPRNDGTRVAYFAGALVMGLGVAAWAANAQDSWDVPPAGAPRQAPPEPTPPQPVTPEPAAPGPMFPGAAPEAGREAPKADEAELAAIAEDAWVYGYPLVLLEVTRRQATNVPAPMGTDAPVNQFARAETFPDPSFKQVVRPNVDTLYASAWLDLSEPVVLHVPAMNGRYHVLPILDAWTNVFASIGSRTTGDGPADYLIVGPSWNGAAPPGMAVVRAPTQTAWILGRTVVNGPADLPAARAAQEGYTLTALSAADGQPPPLPPASVDPLLDTRTRPPDLVAAMDGPTFFRTLARAMKTNPPAPADAPALARFAAIGLVPGEDFPASATMAPGAMPGMGPDSMGHGAMGHEAMGHGAMGHEAMGQDGMEHGAMGPDAMGHDAMGHGAMGHDAMGHGAMHPGAAPADSGMAPAAPGAAPGTAQAGPRPGTPENWSTTPPAPAEAPTPGGPAGMVGSPDASARGAAMRAAIEGAPARGLARVKAHVETLAGSTGAWTAPPSDTGQYGTNYDDRAAIALAGLGANLPADAVYQQARADESGAPLDGTRRYVMHFGPGETPPVRAFWSVTVYDPEGALVPNPIGRYAIGDRDPLVRNADGSLDIYVQAEPPAGYEANWLPAPQGPFNLTLRMYWPEEPVLTGAWTAPALQRLPEAGTY